MEPEAHGDGGTMFGTEPLRQLAGDMRDQHPAAVIDALMQAREDFLGAYVPDGNGGRPTDELSDDATVIILDL